jgi:hypothetical protein
MAFTVGNAAFNDTRTIQNYSQVERGEFKTKSDMIAPGNIITINGKRYEAQNAQRDVNESMKVNPTNICALCAFKDFDCFGKIDCYSLEHVIYFKEIKP